MAGVNNIKEIKGYNWRNPVVPFFILKNNINRAPETGLKTGKETIP